MRILVSLAVIALISAPSVAADTSQKWQQEAVKRYPDLGKSGSPLNKRFVAQTRELQKSDPGFFKNEQWPLVLAGKCSDELLNESQSAPPSLASPAPPPGWQRFDVAKLSLHLPTAPVPGSINAPATAKYLIESFESFKVETEKIQCWISRAVYVTDCNLDSGVQGSIIGLQQQKGVSDFSHTISEVRVGDHLGKRVDAYFTRSGFKIGSFSLQMLQGREMWDVRIVGLADDAWQFADRVLPSLRMASTFGSLLASTGATAARNPTPSPAGTPLKEGDTGILKWQDPQQFATFTTAGHTKADGLSLTIRYPNEWTPKEGNRDRILQKFIEPGGQRMVAISTKTLPIPKASLNEAEFAELFTPEDMKETLPANADRISTSRTKVGGHLANVAEYRVSENRNGIAIEMHFVAFTVFHGTSLVEIHCSVMGLASDSAALEIRRLKSRPLFEAIANSISFVER